MDDSEKIREVNEQVSYLIELGDNSLIDSLISDYLDEPEDLMVMIALLSATNGIKSDLKNRITLYEMTRTIAIEKCLKAKKPLCEINPVVDILLLKLK